MLTLNHCGLVDGLRVNLDYKNGGNFFSKEMLTRENAISQYNGPIQLFQHNLKNLHFRENEIKRKQYDALIERVFR